MENINLSDTNSLNINFLFSKYKNIKNLYSNKKIGCLNVSLDIKNMLEFLGFECKILQLSLYRENNTWHGLVPFFDPNLSWGFHYVCETNGYIFDPVFETPIKKENYSQKMFGKKLQFLELKNLKKL